MDENEMSNIALEAIEVGRQTGKIKKGCNEVTKALERGTAKLVAYAGDVNPSEIIMHIPVLAKEKGIVAVKVPSRTDLGAAAGLPVATVAVAVVKEGDAKDKIQQLADAIGQQEESN